MQKMKSLRRGMSGSKKRPKELTSRSYPIVERRSYKAGLFLEPGASASFGKLTVLCMRSNSVKNANNLSCA